MLVSPCLVSGCMVKLHKSLKMFTPIVVYNNKQCKKHRPDVYIFSLVSTDKSED